MAANATVLEPPMSGQFRTVEPGLFWVRLGLPFKLDHVNAWVLDDGPGWTVIDTGVDDPSTRAAWTTLLTGPLAHKPVRRVIATHFHPDHIGLAHWLVERDGAEFATAQAEWLIARTLSRNGVEALEEAERFYRRAGLPADAMAAILARGNAYARAVPRVPMTYRRLRRGDTVTVGGAAWRVVGGAGHTPEPVALYRADRPLLIAGDQVLPRISPNISVWPEEPDADPLSDFLEGFAHYDPLAPDTFVLPSHGRPFHGLHHRLAELRDHHQERLDETLLHCRDGLTAAELSARLFPPGLDAHQTVFAVGEAIAHLNHLVRQGRIVRRTRPDGVHSYRTAT